MSTIHDERYGALVASLKKSREVAGLSQGDLAKKLGLTQSQISKVETRERRLDVVELWDWIEAIGENPMVFLSGLGWSESASSGKHRKLQISLDNGVALPLAGRVEPTEGGVHMLLRWRGEIKKVFLAGISEDQYLQAEAYITNLFRLLNQERSGTSNRKAICDALMYAVTALPQLNPSDVYHQMVYRLYLREYHKTRPEQSWVRSGGEAMELFVQEHYSPILATHGIRIQALFSAQEKRSALDKMGLVGRVGNSKLDVALYGKNRGREVIFGGVHCKASLAERVSDDVPCSEAMMNAGLSSFLYTFDAKSYPPPQGNLVNYGELGSPSSPSDKREYIESHGSFDACYSYNTRTMPSVAPTASGKQIWVCTLQADSDIFPKHVVDAWRNYERNL